MDEKEYKEHLESEGIELEEEETPQETEETPEETEEETPEETEDDSEEQPEGESEDDSEESESTLQKPKEKKKRSIYDEYKDKKSQLREEQELREKAEAEKAELEAKLEALKNADTTREQETVSSDIDEFAKEIGADPVAIRKMKELFLKDVKPSDESIKKDLEDFRAWKADNQKALEKQAFEEEFADVLPQIKKDFPNASDSEIKAIKTEVDKLSHTRDFHDKDLDYVVFKNRDTLSALVSPKKKGMETKERKDISTDSFEFDPNADVSKLSPKEQEQWMDAYHKATSSDSLAEDSEGRKILL